MAIKKLLVSYSYSSLELESLVLSSLTIIVMLLPAHASEQGNVIGLVSVYRIN